MSLKFPEFSATSTNAELEKLLKWTSKAGPSKGDDPNKFQYFLSLCRYSCILPPWDEKEKEFCDHYEPAILNIEMMEIIERWTFLRYSPSTPILFPVAVPNSELSVFHAISTAMWGLRDSHGTIKQLMEKEATIMADLLFARWLACRPVSKDHQNAWNDIRMKLEGKRPLADSESEDFYSLAIFVLANVIQRPILVINYALSSLNATAGNSPKTLDLEGIYLPLEKPSSSCCKSPIVLCYNDNHFCPLMLKCSENKEVNYPLFRGDHSLLPIKFTEKETKTETVLRQYLNVREQGGQYRYVREQGVTLDTKDSTVPLAYFSAPINPLPDHINPMDSHYKECQDVYEKVVASRNIIDTKKCLQHVPQSLYPSISSPFHYIDDNNQTKVVRLSNKGVKEGHSSSSPFSSLAAPSLSSSFSLLSLSASPSAHGRKKQVAGNAVNHQMAQENNEMLSETLDGIHGQPAGDVCITPGCSRQRDPDIGEMCEACFKKSTIDSSGLELMSICDGEKHGYVMRPANWSSGTEILPETSSRSLVGGAGLVEENSSASFPNTFPIPFLSAVNALCTMCSHYYCSQSTYPYCHECNRTRATVPGVSSQSAIFGSQYNNLSDEKCASIIRPLEVNRPQNQVIRPVEVNHQNPIGSSQHTFPVLNNQKGKERSNPTRQHFCRTQDCPNLLHVNSEFCSACIFSGQESTTKQQTLNKSLDQTSRCVEQFGQAECLAPDTEENLIEISEPPPSNNLHKCGSPICQTVVSKTQALCEKCENILIAHSKHTTCQETRHQKKSSDSNIKQTVPRSSHHRDSFSDVITRPPPLNAEGNKKGHSEKIKRAPGLSLINMASPNETPKEVNKSTSNERRFTNHVERLPKERAVKVEMKRLPPPPPSLQGGVFSSGPFHSNPPGSRAEAAEHLPSSVRRAVDSQFHKVYAQVANEQSKGVARCLSSHCSNYGNSLKGGYCNSCFSLLSRQERHVAIFGETVPG